MLMDIEQNSSEDNLEVQQLRQATVNSLLDQGFFFLASPRLNFRPKAGEGDYQITYTKREGGKNKKLI